MVGYSHKDKTGIKVVGKNGEYIVGNFIAKGGNGEVYVARIVDDEEVLPRKGEYVIKFLEIKTSDKNERKKREARFIKEIQKVISFQNLIDGVIPIYDSSIYSKESQEFLWYLMPKAEKYNSKNFSVLQRLGHMYDLGICLRQLHEHGYAHRDIKPKNLLLLDNKVHLTDFGLVWNIEEADEHITEVNDCLGPQAIRPPELQPVEKIEGINYMKSDVYLYAKTVWMVLCCNNSGFSLEYSRQNDNVYIFKEKYGLETAEPLHRLMEEATRHNFWERPNIQTCIEYLKNQISVIQGDINEQTLRTLKYSEESKRMELTLIADEKTYSEITSILEILNNMSGIVDLAFFETTKEYCRCPLKKALYIQGNIFEIEIQNPYNRGKKKRLMIDIENIHQKKAPHVMYEIQMGKKNTEDKSVPVFTNIIKALESPSKNVILNAEYIIKMV